MHVQIKAKEKLPKEICFESSSEPFTDPKTSSRLQFNEMTNEMDLWSTVGNATVGQYICEDLYSHFIFFIHNSYVRKTIFIF